ncbi:hypothetical protein [Helcococcus kunzii]|uniref:hypothetical protein n=1 Tax=Helcococcus kunzii TaxID=40091 RepID=UPI001BAFC7FE|nr:hypothetical protein [Helcococcus kunzii]MCT1796911.1 hypothetical protein [Helcococcus kunzii]MCT1988531.1 hypothetical protein [Helcococcus kunzii]QUY65627.1 hypothetical protein GUI37_08870 [Helcococcus kunzii]
MEFIKLLIQYVFPAAIAISGNIYISKKLNENIKVKTYRTIKSYEIELVNKNK